MADEFTYDVFLSHSSKAKAVVLPLAERLRADGRHRIRLTVKRPGQANTEAEATIAFTCYRRTLLR